MNVLSDRVSYLPASSQPLSADVGFIHGDQYEWIFDVGCCDEAAEQIRRTGRKNNVVLSHFHPDHTGNLPRIVCEALYCGGYTSARLGAGWAVRTPVSFDDGVRITVFPIPSVHAKGSVGLEVDERFAFLGDAVYSASKAGRQVWNVSLLRETILTLSALRADTFLISHHPGLARSKAEVLAELDRVYRLRRANEPYVCL